MNRVRLVFRSSSFVVAVIVAVVAARPAFAQADHPAGQGQADEGQPVNSNTATDDATTGQAGGAKVQAHNLGCACPHCGDKVAASDAGTDHQAVVRRWGIEARRVAVLNASGNNIDPRCGTGDGTRLGGACPVAVNAFGVRRWVHEGYGWNAALALAMGGGATDGNTVTGGGTWDTHFGVGPILGANFLLGQARHLAVSALPQIGFLAFLPSGSGSKTFMLDVRALIEAELHLGFIGLPQVSIGTSTGLVVNWVKKTRGDDRHDRSGGIPGTTTFAAWDVGFVGPQSLWGLLTQSFVRVYF